MPGAAARGPRPYQGPENGSSGVCPSPKLNKIFILFNYPSTCKTSFPLTMRTRNQELGTDGSAVGGMIPICPAPPDSAIPHSELIKPAASGQASPESFEIGMIRDELDSLHQPLRVSAGRRLHAGQRRRGGPPRPGRRLRPLYPDGRRAARIASPIFRAGISSRPAESGRAWLRDAGTTQRVNPSRRTSETRWPS